ncbi:hypothetical protein GW764_01240 [Candidatus Parcubacteria bacterium]|nr:hypothetical protein [Candidatus Parcubacteria bacterium]
MNKIKNNRKIVGPLLLLFFLVGSVFGYRVVLAAIDIVDEWGETIVRDPRYVGSDTVYSESASANKISGGACKIDYNSSSSWRDNRDLSGRAEILSREISNSGWGLVCDSSGSDNVWADILACGSYTKSGFYYQLSQRLHVDLGAGYTGDEGMSLRINQNHDSTNSGRDVLIKSDEDAFVFELENYHSNPDEIKRVEIYVNDVYLKTLFPDPATSVGLKLSKIELLNIELYDSYSGFDRLDVRINAYGENSSYSIAEQVVIEPNINYIPEGIDITVYGNSYKKQPYSFIVNSINQPIYINDKYIDPAKTPIEIKASGDILRGNGWFVKFDENTIFDDFIAVDGTGADYDVWKSDVFYDEEEDINGGILRAPSGVTLSLESVRLDGVEIDSSRYYLGGTYSNNLMLINQDLESGPRRLEYDYSYVYNGYTYERNNTTDFLIVKNDLNKIRSSFWNDNKFYLEIDFKNFSEEDAPLIEYETSWGESGSYFWGKESYTNGEYNQGMRFNELLDNLLNDSTTRWELVRDGVVEDPNKPYYSSGWVPKWAPSDEGGYAIPYDGDIDIRVTFFDGQVLNKNVKISDIVSVSKIQDIEGVGTYFKIKNSEEYSFVNKWRASQDSSDSYFNVSSRQIISSTDEGGDYHWSIENSVGNYKLLGNNQYGILEQPDYQFDYYSDAGGYDSLGRDQYKVNRTRFDNPIGSLNRSYGYNIVNIPFNVPYYYLHDPYSDEIRGINPSCVDYTDPEPIPPDDPLEPPVYPPTEPPPPKPENFVLDAAAMSNDGCYYQEEPYNVELVWGNVDTASGYSVYIDYDNNGLFEDSEKIADPAQNSTTTNPHNLKEAPNFAEGNTYTYQVKAWYEFDGQLRSYTAEDSVTVPAECVVLEPLSCGTLTETSNRPSESNTNLCSVDANVVSSSIVETYDNLGWSWQCSQDSNTVPCTAYCPYEKRVCGDVCISDDQPCGNECPDDRWLCGSECIPLNQPCGLSCEEPYVLSPDETECIISDNSDVTISVFNSNPRLINEGENCKLDWLITTENTNLIDCEITSDNNQSQSLGLTPNTSGTIASYNIFENVNSQTNYTLTCRAYNPDTGAMGSIIDSKQTRCMINPYYIEF